MIDHSTTNYKNLVAFSSGQATAAQTLERLGMVSSEDLFLLMAQAYLPMPRVPEVATKAMVHSLHQLPTAKLAETTISMPPEVPGSDIAQRLDPINAFRGSGTSGSTQRLIADRKAEAKLTQPVPHSSSPGGDPVL